MVNMNYPRRLCDVLPLKYIDVLCILIFKIVNFLKWLEAFQMFWVDILGNSRACSSDSQTRAVKNWERFTILVLEREYKMIQQEIEERQRTHFRSRELYIEEILNSHHEDMANFSMQRRQTTVNDFDKKFITNYQKVNCYSLTSYCSSLIFHCSHFLGNFFHHKVILHFLFFFFTTAQKNIIHMSVQLKDC